MDTVIILAVLLAIIVIGVIWVRRSKSGPTSSVIEDQDTAWNDPVSGEPPHQPNALQEPDEP